MMIKDYKLLIELQYSYGTNGFKIWKSEMLSKYKWLTLIIILMKIKQSIIQPRPYIIDHSCRILIIGGSGSGSTIALLDLINNQLDIYKIYSYAKDPYEIK